MKSGLHIVYCRTVAEIQHKVSEILLRYQALLPKDRNARILLKPNLNSYMNGLTGNTTDLRVLSAVLCFLKQKGYRNIVVGEGTNSGFYRNRIGVINRLRVDAIARHYGVGVTDLNDADPVEIDFADGVKAQVARDCIETDLLINLPKLKTHFEVGMSVCLKNVMGCLVGQENKKKTHQNLPENILRLNRYVRPHLHIVDALVAMEGLGPTRGTPVRMDTVLIGEDPLLVDLACARMAGFDWRRVGTLALAARKGLLTRSHHRYVQALDMGAPRRPFIPPKPGALAALIHHPKRQKYFARVRDTALFSYLASTGWFGNLLFRSGLRQDVFLKDDMALDCLALDRGKCTGCGVCRDVCPIFLDLPDHLALSGNGCIGCLYCYAACPEKAIRVYGDLGFFREQIRQYDRLIRGLYR